MQTPKRVKKDGKAVKKEEVKGEFFVFGALSLCMVGVLTCGRRGWAFGGWG